MDQHRHCSVEQPVDDVIASRAQLVHEIVQPKREHLPVTTVIAGTGWLGGLGRRAQHDTF